MQDLETLQQSLNAKEKEIAALKKEIDQARDRAWREKWEERRRQVEEKHGAVIQKINEHIAAAAQSMEAAIALAKENGIASLTGYNPHSNDAKEQVDLDMIGRLIQLDLITHQLYEAGVEHIDW
jgi:uncharacterized protein (DUF342 family)